MRASQLDIKTIIKDFVMPALIALIPFLPSIYNLFTEPDFHFIYEFTYKKNPVIEWNRQIDKLISQLGTSSKGTDALPPDLLLRKIGKEIYSALPAMASEIGFKPMDSEIVYVVNISSYGLRNIRAHFNGCIGFDSYATWPDTIGSMENRQIPSNSSVDSVTIRYNILPPRQQSYFPTTYYNNARLTYYGTDTSQCRPMVEAELDKGGSAIGKQTDLSSYLSDLRSIHSRNQMLADYTFKAFIFIALVYGFYQIRSLKKRITLPISIRSQQ
jgi:hypothetical protein